MPWLAPALRRGVNRPQVVIATERSALLHGAARREIERLPVRCECRRGIGIAAREWCDLGFGPMPVYESRYADDAEVRPDRAFREVERVAIRRQRLVTLVVSRRYD